MKGNLKQMNVVHIPVSYPTTEEVVVISAEDMQAKGYKKSKGLILYYPVNRPQRITVKQVSRLVQEEFMSSEDYEAELDAMCLAQTGLTRSQYQARYKRAWND